MIIAIFNIGHFAVGFMTGLFIVAIIAWYYEKYVIR
jgi:hypothetical protein